MAEFNSSLLAVLRRQRSLTQEGLAEKLGVHANTYANWERGGNAPPADELYKIATFFQISMEQFFHGASRYEQAFAAVGQYILTSDETLAQAAEQAIAEARKEGSTEVSLSDLEITLYYHRGISYLKKVLACCNEALLHVNHDAMRVQLLEMKTRIHFHLNEGSQITKEYEAIYAGMPSEENLQFLLNCYKWSASLERVRETALAHLERSPDSPTALYFLGSEYTQQGQSAEALTCWDRFFSGPGSPLHDKYRMNAYFLCAQCCDQLQQNERAEEQLKLGLQMAQDNQVAKLLIPEHKILLEKYKILF